jgi:hypothetical protein
VDTTLAAFTSTSVVSENDSVAVELSDIRRELAVVHDHGPLINEHQATDPTSGSTASTVPSCVLLSTYSEHDFGLDTCH